MDTFMDKLSQKLTAQEIINANTSADTEELNQLKAGIKEYNECLSKMRKMNEEMQAAVSQIGGLMDGAIAPKMNELVESAVSKLNSVQVDTDNIDRLVEESLAKIREVREKEDEAAALRDVITQLGEKQEEYVHKENVKVYRNVQAVVVEESGKQAEVFHASMRKLSGRQNAVFGLALGTLLVSLAGLVLQILIYLG